MKKILLLSLLCVFGLVTESVYCQSTNSAPSGLTVTQPSAQTVTNFTPAVIYANPTETATLTTAYFSPLLSATGVTVPSGAVPRTFMVTYFSDGSSRSTTTFCAARALPAPPPRRPALLKENSANHFL